MTKLEKRVEELEREVADLRKEIQGIPLIVGKAILEAAKEKAEIETAQRKKELDSWSIERIMADRHKRLP